MRTVDCAHLWSILSSAARPSYLPGWTLHANIGCGQRRAPWRQRRHLGGRWLWPELCAQHGTKEDMVDDIKKLLEDYKDDTKRHFDMINN